MRVIAVKTLKQYANKKKEAEQSLFAWYQEACKANVAAMNAQTELYYVQLGGYPPTLNALFVADYIDAVPICPITGSTNYTYTSSTGRITKPHAHP